MPPKLKRLLRPLLNLTSDGTLTQTGGQDDGALVVRSYKSCDTCDWVEVKNGLNQQRWYATNHILPDGRQIIIGGRQIFNYEFYPKTLDSENSVDFPFLTQTNDPTIENNLYPFVLLNPDGNLFVFANNRAILFDYLNNQVVKTFPTIPGGEPRNYPSTGSAVLLPLKIIQGSISVVEVLVCGGAPRSAFPNANIGVFDGALDTCGRIKISDPDPEWVMETMPMARVMGDMVLLPNGQVLIINGGSSGTAGWELCRGPVLSPVIYRPHEEIGSRFEVQNPSTVARLYHSTAVLLRDGRVLVGGSNPHDKYVFADVMYPTELSLEQFSPSYLDSSSSGLRPVIISPATGTTVGYGNKMVITFSVEDRLDPSSVLVTMVAPSFNTHSFSMNQRLLILDSENVTTGADSLNYQVSVTMPPSGNIAPAGFYLQFVVHKDIPSQGIWIYVLGSFENSYIPENPRTPPISYISQTVIPFKKPTSEPSKTGFETKQKTVHICTKKSLHICKVFGKKKSFFRKKLFATGLIFERFLAPRSRFFEKVNDLAIHVLAKLTDIPYDANMVDKRCVWRLPKVVKLTLGMSSSNQRT
ncbi:hypothetical protein LXL04_008786 [Taraxacum kok-saghyz]